MKKSMDRRSFLQLSAAGSLAAGLATLPEVSRGKDSREIGISQDPVVGSAGKPGVRRYVPLGRTGLQISDISFGSSRLKPGQEHLVHHALDLGVNYFDTAESYTDGSSETVLGKALKGKRDSIFIATKTGAGADTPQETIMSSLEESLRRLQTDHVDIYFNHAVNDVERLQNPEWFEFADKAKQQGKIRFTGMSGHAGHLIECLDYALDEDLLDVMLVAYNFGQDPAFYDKFTKSFDFIAKQPDLPRVLQKAKEKQVGVVAMKVLKGARLNDMRPFEKEGATYAQAAFRWAFQSQQVDAAIISMTSVEQIDEYLGASGTQDVSQQDLQLLEHYARMTNFTYCRHACNDCEGACPFDVPIADVLRTRMYATDYGDLEFAKHEYSQLEHSAAACLGCDGQPCRDACSHAIPVASLCGPTHLMLG